METTPTPFDLNQAIQHWRDGLAQSPAIQGENLDELETHLRDSVARLQAQALSAEEAFLIATKRVGSTARLDAEFGKVNSQSTWLDRVFWAVVIMQAWGVLENLGGACTVFFSNSIYSTVFSSPSKGSSWTDCGVYFIGTLIPILFTILLALLIWRLVQFSTGRFGTILKTVSGRPLTVATTFLSANLLAHLLLIASYDFMGHQWLPGHLWVINYLRPLPGYFLYAAVSFVLARKRSLKKA